MPWPDRLAIEHVGQTRTEHSLPATAQHPLEQHSADAAEPAMLQNQTRAAFRGCKRPGHCRHTVLRVTLPGVSQPARRIDFEHLAIDDAAPAPLWLDAKLKLVPDDWCK